MPRRPLYALCYPMFLVLALALTWAQAAQVQLTWDTPTSADGTVVPNLAGYKLYYGLSSGNYNFPTIDVGLQTSYTVPDLVDGQTYYFAVTAYDRSGRESSYSNEVSTTVGAAALVANFSVSPAQGPAPLPVTFINLSTGNITAWHWNFGDGSTSPHKAPSHTYTTAGTYRVTLTVTGPDGADAAALSVTVTDFPRAREALLAAQFETDPQGFVYVAHAFPAPRQLQYTAGQHSQGALQITLGGIDKAEIRHLSGGWQRSFTVAGPTPADVSLRFRYNLTQTANYDPDEYSEVRATVGTQSLGDNGHVARLTGDGDGGAAQTTGWQTFATTLQLAPGVHVLTLGGYNNKKTFPDEVTTILIDDVVVAMDSENR